MGQMPYLKAVDFKGTCKVLNPMACDVYVWAQGLGNGGAMETMEGHWVLFENLKMRQRSEGGFMRGVYPFV